MDAFHSLDLEYLIANDGMTLESAPSPASSSFSPSLPRSTDCSDCPIPKNYDHQMGGGSGTYYCVIAWGSEAEIYPTYTTCIIACQYLYIPLRMTLKTNSSAQSGKPHLFMFLLLCILHYYFRIIFVLEAEELACWTVPFTFLSPIPLAIVISSFIID